MMSRRIRLVLSVIVWTMEVRISMTAQVNCLLRLFFFDEVLLIRFTEY